MNANETEDDFVILYRNRGNNMCPIFHADGVCDCGPYNESVDDRAASSLYEDKMAHETILGFQNTSEDLKARNDVLTKQMAKHDETIGQLKRQTYQNDSENAKIVIRLNAKLKASMDQIFKYQKTIKDLTTKLGVSTAQVAGHESDFNEERSLREKAVGDKNTWQTRCNELFAENSALNDNVVLLKAEVNNANQSVDYFKRSLHESRQDQNSLTKQFGKLKLRHDPQPPALPHLVTKNPSAPPVENAHDYRHIPQYPAPVVAYKQTHLPPFYNKMSRLYEPREQSSRRSSSDRPNKYNAYDQRPQYVPKIPQMKLRPEFQSPDYKAKVLPVRIRVHPETDGHISFMMGNGGQDEVDGAIAEYDRDRTFICGNCGLHFDGEVDMDLHLDEKCTGSCTI